MMFTATLHAVPALRNFEINFPELIGKTSINSNFFYLIPKHAFSIFREYYTTMYFIMENVLIISSQVVD